MDTFPWLTVAAALPAVGAAVLMLLGSVGKSAARPFGVLVSLVTFGVMVVAGLQFDVSRAGEQQLTESMAWIPQFGVTYALGVNGVGLAMILLATLLVPLCLLGLWDAVPADAENAASRQRTFVALVLALETMMIGVFAARDVFLFYVLFEAMLIPTYFLIANFGGAGARKAAVKFLLYSLAGGLIMLVAVIALYFQGPGGTDGFLIDKLTGLEFSSSAMEQLLFWAFFFAFAVKAPMVPLHTWLPDAAEEAPAGVSVLIVGVLDKVGTFGMLTLCLVLFPDAAVNAAPGIIFLALVSMIYGGLAAIGSRNIKRLIAYTSVSHFGFIVMGIFAMTSTGQAGAALYMVNHGFSTAALFLIAGMFIARRGSANVGDFGGYQRVTPWLAGSFLLAGLSSLALPGMSSFVSEFLVITGTFQRYSWAAVIGVIGLVLSAMYILITYKRMMTGPKPEDVDVPDVLPREVFVIAPLIAIIIALGFYPKPVLDLINPAVEATMDIADVSDPAPIADGGKTP